MNSEKKTDVQGHVMELRRLRAEEKTLEKMLTEAKGQLTNLQIEALEIKSRIRTTRKTNANDVQ